MRLNSKVTWGLAWAGLAVVVAVPSLDFVTGKSSAKTAAVVTSTTDPVIPATQTAVPLKTAAVTTKITPSGITITPSGKSSSDPVNDYLKTNNSLPDYISGGSSTASASADNTESSAPTKVATIDPTPPQIAPVPFPARPPDTVTPGGDSTTAPSYTATRTTSASSSPAPQGAAPKLYAPADNQDDIAPPMQEAAADPTGPVPPASIDDGSDWQGPGLQRYLRRNGLLDDGDGGSTASVTVVNRNDGNYDPNGFYLNDGPNDARLRRRARVQRMLEDQGNSDGGWLPSFNLF